jgi:hypothetical protein
MPMYKKISQYQAFTVEQSKIMERPKKEYGKLSRDQFKQLVRKLPEIRKKQKEPPKLLHSVPEEEKHEILGEELSWTNVYELPLEKQLALLFIKSGRAEKLHEAAQSGDPTQAAMDLFGNDEFLDLRGEEVSVNQKREVISLLTALKRNVLAIMLFDRPLNQMIEEVKTGNDDSLFLAVCIDRSVVACPIIADRIARAEFENDENFFVELSKSLSGPSGKYWESYKDLRYAFCLLRDSGIELSTAELEELFIHELELYPDTPGARRNLRELFTKSKKKSTISK